MTQLGHAGITGAPVLAQINGMITQQSATLAANDIYWISGWLFLVLVVSVWFAGKTSGDGMVAEL